MVAALAVFILGGEWAERQWPVYEPLFALCTISLFTIAHLYLLFTSEDRRLAVAESHRCRPAVQGMRHPDNRRNLADLIQTRRAWWCTQLYRSSSRSFLRAERTSRMVFAIAACTMLWGLNMIRFWESAMFAGLCTFFVAAGFLAYREPFVHRRAAKALLDRNCPDCGYALEAVPDAIDAAKLAGVRIGPSTCPECGVRWPLVPGPTPDEALAALLPAKPPFTPPPARPHHPAPHSQHADMPVPAARE